MVKAYLLSLNKRKLKNVFSSKHKKRVLLSYIQRPFVMKKFGLVSFKHTNFNEALAIADIFHSLGYRVDVVEYDSEIEIDYTQYDVIFGFGDPFQSSFSASNKLIRIFYGTGMNVNTQNENTLQRMYSFYTKHSVWLPESIRYVSKQWAFQYSFSDAILALGNKTCSLSYEKHSLRSVVYEIPSFYYKKHDAFAIVDERFSTKKRDYLWFGSSGAIHKGLDLVLDYFIDNDTDEVLHICGLIESENKFWGYYEDFIESRSNIQYHGFVDIESLCFETILRNCAFVIYPSCSEGGAPSVLNCVGNGGLLPIITLETTIDIDEAIVIENYDYSSISKAISKANSLTSDELKEKQILSLQSVKKTYTFEKYRKAMKTSISETLKKEMQC